MTIWLLFFPVGKWEDWILRDWVISQSQTVGKVVLRSNPLPNELGLKNYPLFIWNSDITRHPAFLCAKSGNPNLGPSGFKGCVFSDSVNIHQKTHENLGNILLYLNLLYLNLLVLKFTVVPYIHISIKVAYSPHWKMCNMGLKIKRTFFIWVFLDLGFLFLLLLDSYLSL